MRREARDGNKIGQGTVATRLILKGERAVRKIDIDEYRQIFLPHTEKALQLAHDIRKFEIDLYWKRATYFWTFIAATFAGYFAIQAGNDFASVYVVTCLGFLFSLGWYYVNRGSGAWQKNWEKHVDLLEDGVTGPLYKTLLDNESYRPWDLLSPYSFSPSRINNLLALTVTIVWLLLIVRTLWKVKHYLPVAVPDFSFPFSITACAMTVLTIIAALFLTFYGKAGHLTEEDRPMVIDIQMRDIPKSAHSTQDRPQLASTGRATASVGRSAAPLSKRLKMQGKLQSCACLHRSAPRSSARLPILLPNWQL